MTVQAILNAGEFPHSVDITIKAGIVTNFHYNLPLNKARSVLYSLWLSGHEIDYSESDPFIKKLVVGEE